MFDFNGLTAFKAPFLLPFTKASVPFPNYHMCISTHLIFGRFSLDRGRAVRVIQEPVTFVICDYGGFDDVGGRGPHRRRR